MFEILVHKLFAVCGSGRNIELWIKFKEIDYLIQNTIYIITKIILMLSEIDYPLSSCLNFLLPFLVVFLNNILKSFLRFMYTCESNSMARLSFCRATEKGMWKEDILPYWRWYRKNKDRNPVCQNILFRSISKSSENKSVCPDASKKATTMLFTSLNGNLL